MISPNYSDSGNPIAVGDKVLIDDLHSGTVVEIFAPGTEDAKAYSCFETGGLLLKLDRYGLALERFGNSSDVTKIIDE
ncbi:hypothetical protein K2Y11_17000 [bacterium]|nr:hypothetical protein [bacterium]